MSDLDKKDEVLDPVILAAMVEDPDEDEEDKKLRKEILGTEETTSTDDKNEDDEEEDPKDTKKPDDSESEDEDEAEESKDDEKDPEKKDKKPVEAQDDSDEDDEDDEEEEKPKTRKEKRQQRFLDSILKDTPRKSKSVQVPEYNPVDYTQAPEEGFKPTELAEDRERHGAVQFVKGAQAVRYWAEQDRFWSELDSEAKLLSYDPKLNFLSEETPDGKPNERFDPDKAEEINATYLTLIGFKQYHKTDNEGRKLFTDDGQPILISTVEKPEISYEKFARRYVQNMESWSKDDIEDKVEETRDKVIKQKKQQGIRPGGGTRKTLGALKLGDISRMSHEELEKNEAEIDRQILNML